MNTLHLHAHGPATHAGHALHNKLDEIAAGVRGLREQAETPPTANKAELAEDPVAGNEEAAGAFTVTPSAAAPEAGRVEGASVAAETRVRPVLPQVPDLRPELAALTTALTQQHVATVQALHQVVGLCQAQRQEVERLGREMATLKNRLNQIPF